MRWPGKIPAGTVCREMAATIDILPTVAGLVGVELPDDRIIDGKDIWPLISGQPGAKTPHEVYCYYYYATELHAVRSGPWKLHFPHRYRSLDGRPGGTGGMPVRYTMKRTGPGLELYNLETDIGETTNVAEQHPEVVKRLEALAEKAREDLGDKLTKRKGKNVRPHGERQSAK